MPAVAKGVDQSRAKELLETTATHSQSFVAVLHNTLHPDASSRPPQAAPAVRLAHWLIGGTLVLITLWAAGWRRPCSGAEELLFLSSLVVLMLLLSPVCHLHYFCVLVPMLMGLMIPDWQRANPLQARAGMKVLLGVALVACALPLIPGLEFARDLGLSLYGALLLWAVAVWRLFRTAKSSGLDVRQEQGPAKAAA